MGVTAGETEQAHNRMLRMLSLCIGLAGLLYVGVAHPALPAQWGIAAPWWTVFATGVVLVPLLLMAAGSFFSDVRWLRRIAAVLITGYAPVLVLVVLAFPQDIFSLEFDIV